MSIEPPKLSLPAGHVAVLRLLVVRTAHQRIAQQLHVGARTVDRRVTEIREALGTSRRFCVGVRAVSSGLVDSHHVIAHACRRRRGAHWVAPTDRPLEIIRLLADDTDVRTVAPIIGVSASTVWADLSQLSAVNGAANLTHLGALATGLSWT